MDRRTLLARLVAAGVTSSLAACLEVSGSDPIPTGDPAERPDRQHAWNDRLERDEHGNYLLPNHHVYLSLEYAGDDPEGDRDQFEAALTDLEHAYAADHEGLLFTVGYAPSYFERFDATPETVDLSLSDDLVPGENVGRDDADVLVHLASGRADAVLEAEEALFGPEDANDTPIASIDDLFAVDRRRTGFVGAGLPKERQDHLNGLRGADVHEAAPFFTNFRSGLRQNQATEDRVTIKSGPYAGGTTQVVAGFWLTLSSWFDQSPDQQVAKLFSPALEAEDVGPAGVDLTDHNRVEPASEDALREHATDDGVVGHAQKLARFRENGRPPILRRDVNSDDTGEAGMVFVSLQESVETFERLRRAMAGRNVVGEGDVEESENNGILEYAHTRYRGSFLIPPRDRRSLPL